MHARPGRLLAAAAFFAVLAVAAHAGEKSPRAVVELFTSQGCNSCPPADRNLADLAKSGEVIALGYHVDYWDYLGWQDTLASPENTARQHEYGRAFGLSAVYTPQAVINGRQHVNGASRDKIDHAMAEMARSGKGLSVDVAVSRSGDSLLIDTGDGGGEAGKAHVVLVFFEKTRAVKIDRGENAGKTLTYWNPVTGVQTAGMWHGRAKRFELPLTEVEKQGAGGCAVLLQRVDEDGMPGAIIGAAMLESPAG